jgi:hypothetical protein
VPFPQQNARPFSRDGIESLTPNQHGVYGILNNREWIYIGRGDIRERLLAHLMGTGGQPGILSRRPTRYVTEVTANDAEREKELIGELDPVCNRVAAPS